MIVNISAAKRTEFGVLFATVFDLVPHRCMSLQGAWPRRWLAASEETPKALPKCVRVRMCANENLSLRLLLAVALQSVRLLRENSQLRLLSKDQIQFSAESFSPCVRLDDRHFLYQAPAPPATGPPPPPAAAAPDAVRVRQAQLALLDWANVGVCSTGPPEYTLQDHASALKQPMESWQALEEALLEAWAAEEPGWIGGPDSGYWGGVCRPMLDLDWRHHVSVVKPCWPQRSYACERCRSRQLDSFTGAVGHEVRPGQRCGEPEAPVAGWDRETCLVLWKREVVLANDAVKEEAKQQSRPDSPVSAVRLPAAACWMPWESRREHEPRYPLTRAEAKAVSRALTSAHARALRSAEAEAEATDDIRALTTTEAEGYEWLLKAMGERIAYHRLISLSNFIDNYRLSPVIFDSLKRQIRRALRRDGRKGLYVGCYEQVYLILDSAIDNTRPRPRGTFRKSIKTKLCVVLAPTCLQANSENVANERTREFFKQLRKDADADPEAHWRLYPDPRLFHPV
ncbi:hypothetical protein GNI_182680 [Gregarina niphandrodes]|uniref:Uncharacterized protein n=1 Tax=Gregarina niphandrodes TaxID=110365 RepID=A0A023AXJ7_GRENI|nr:hypothetical protein GNI_182680 [Gregarina niphandrodes]EZG43208.1 hypothetical protein GNI_182680 [Gregarina niphandrodes]|eukprot:XP_011133539.1 hypothetical protein GNI_182680 [Gregarina niphandrodes]